MTKTTATISLLVVWLALMAGRAGAATPFAQAGPLALRAVTLNRAVVPRYEKLELTLDLSANYDNPFDPEDVSVYADFTSPQAQRVRVNGFLNQKFTRRLDSGHEHLDAAGAPVWTVRFAPGGVGTWQARVVAHDRTGTVSRTVSFRVTPSATPRLSCGAARSNPAVFAYDNGQAVLRPRREHGLGQRTGDVFV